MILGVSQTAMSSTPIGEIKIAAAIGVDDELIAAFNRLVPQLSRGAAVPTPEVIREIVEAPANTVLIARDGRDNGRIVGMLTLVVFRIPTGVRAWIEDVVVDEAARGRGVGEALSQEAIQRAVGVGARTVELTSRPSREGANRLYQRLGFVRRDSNVDRTRRKSGLANQPLERTGKARRSAPIRSAKSRGGVVLVLARLPGQ